MIGAIFRSIGRLVSAEPFTPSQRWTRYVHRTYSAHQLELLGAETALDHALGEPACWDREPARTPADIREPSSAG